MVSSKTMPMMGKICILILVIQIIVEVINGKALQENPEKKITHDRSRREATANLETSTAVPNISYSANVASALVQTSTSDDKNNIFPTSASTPEPSDNISTPISTVNLTITSNEVSIPKTTMDLSLNCYQEDIIPISYNISTTPKLNDWTFSAEMNITVEVFERCATLTLPKNELMINNITLMSESEILSETYHPVNNVVSNNLTIQFLKPIPKGNFKLIVKYSGKINVVPQGLIKGSDANINGLVITASHDLLREFDFTAVQLAFPFWNSLQVKTNLGVTVNVDSNDIIAFSDAHKVEYFNEDANLSHAVSFLLSSYHGLKCHDHHDANYKVCSSWLGPYHVDKMLEKMANITNMSYSKNPFRKLNILLYHKYDLPMDYLQISQCGLIITIYNDRVSHEFLITSGIAYQWLNCLVMPEESSHKWISTGLATYYGMEIIPTDSDRVFQKDIKSVERMEATLYNSDAIITSVISNIKDTNTIHDRAIQMTLDHKATAIVSMISQVVGENKLQIAVENYLKKNLHRTTTSTDLINELKAITNDEHANVNIEEIIKNWLHMQSLPSITVVRNYITGSITITQNPLRIDNPSRAKLYNRMVQFTQRPSNSAEERFWIPINYISSSELSSVAFNNKTVTHWLRPSEKSIVIPAKLGAQELILVNKQNFDYYRVNYDVVNWNLIIRTLRSPKYSSIDKYNRAQLVDDAFSFLEAGQLEYETVFDLIEYLSEEREYLVWIIAERHITRMFSDLLESPDHNFKEYMTNLSRKIANEEFGNFRNRFMQNLYPQLLTAFCRWGSTSCRAQLIELYMDQPLDFDSEPDPIAIDYRLDDSAQLRNLILCTGGQNTTDNSTWDSLENNWSANLLVLNIITCRPDKTMVQKFFSELFKSSVISSKTFFHIVNLFIVNNVESNVFPILYHALKKNMEYMKMPNHMTGPDLDLILELLEVIASIESLTNPHSYELRAFFKKHESRLESYFNHQDIREYLIRSENNKLDLSLPVFTRFRNK